MNPSIIRIEEGDGFTRTYLSQYPDEQSVALARETLKKLEGDVLLEGTFDGDTWVMADGKQKHYFRFVLEEAAFARGAAKWSGCTLEEYVTTVKTHTALQLGTAILATLSSAAREALSLAGLTMEELLASHPGTKAMSILFYLPHPTPERDALFEEVESSPILVTGGDVSQQRSLPSLKTCLLFDYHLDEYWKAADGKKRLAAFPVWLWWNYLRASPAAY